MRIFIAAAITVGLALPAHAWETPPAHSSAAASAKASAKATAAARAAGGNATGTVSVETQRSAAAPALGGLSSGACSGASGGVSLGFLPFGGGANYGAIDPQCTLRNNILIVSTFDRAAAMEMLKGLDGYSDAVGRLGDGVVPVPAHKPPAPPQKPEWCGDPERYAKFSGDLFCR